MFIKSLRNCCCTVLHIFSFRGAMELWSVYLSGCFSAGMWLLPLCPFATNLSECAGRQLPGVKLKPIFSHSLNITFQPRGQKQELCWFEFFGRFQIIFFVWNIRLNTQQTCCERGHLTLLGVFSTMNRRYNFPLLSPLARSVSTKGILINIQDILDEVLNMGLQLQWTGTIQPL